MSLKQILVALVVVLSGVTVGVGVATMLVEDSPQLQPCTP